MPHLFPPTKYLFRFQNVIDNIRGHPSCPTDLECTRDSIGWNQLPKIQLHLAQILWHHCHWVYLCQYEGRVAAIGSLLTKTSWLPMWLLFLPPLKQFHRFPWSTLSSVDPLNPQLTLQCTMCGLSWLKSTHSSGCPSYEITCSACCIVVHKVIVAKLSPIFPNKMSRPQLHIEAIDMELYRTKPTWPKISKKKEKKKG